MDREHTPRGTDLRALPRWSQASRQRQRWQKEFVRRASREGNPLTKALNDHVVFALHCVAPGPISLSRERGKQRAGSLRGFRRGSMRSSTFATDGRLGFDFRPTRIASARRVVSLSGLDVARGWRSCRSRGGRGYGRARSHRGVDAGRTNAFRCRTAPGAPRTRSPRSFSAAARACPRRPQDDAPCAETQSRRACGSGAARRRDGNSHTLHSARA